MGQRRHFYPHTQSLVPVKNRPGLALCLFLSHSVFLFCLLFYHYYPSLVTLHQVDDMYEIEA